MMRATGPAMMTVACLLIAAACGSKEGEGGGKVENGKAGPPPSKAETKSNVASPGPERRAGRPAGVQPAPGEKYRFLDAEGDGDLALLSRVPVDTGQELQLEYFAPYWEEGDPLTLVGKGGFDLLNAGRAFEATNVSVVRNQSFHEMIRVLIQLDYEGEFEGPVELIVYFNDGTGTVVPLGPADRASYRTGVVTADAGVNLRAESDVKAESLAVLGKGSKVFFTGKIDYVQPSEDADLGEFIVFQEVLAEGRAGWAAVGTFGGEEYITTGDFQPY